MLKKSTLLLMVSFLTVAAVSQVQAERLESDSYVIQFGNFNVTSGEKSSDNFNVTDTVGQTGSGPYGQYGSSGYFVGGGFQYIYQIDDFSFSISKTAIPFGVLTPGVHTVDSHTLTISTRGAGGYIVYAYEDKPLTAVDSVNVIPDTTCDASDCTQTTAGVWTNQSIPGFGYNMTGNDIPAAFVNSTYFKQFADRSIGEVMQVVMSSPNIANDRQSTITYKAGILGSQAAGNYETAVSFVAVPGY